MVFASSHTSTIASVVSPVPESPTPSLQTGILFVSDADGNKEIYHMNLNTKVAENLTNNSGDDMNPQVSPNGKTIVFYSNRDGNNEIYEMNLETRAVTQLTSNSADNYDPSYSPDGEKVVFKSTVDDKNGDIFVMNSDGTRKINLTPQRATTEEWDPTFSRDGKKIIFVVRVNKDHRTDELYIMDADGGNPTKLTSNNFSDWYPSVSATDGSIVYISKANASAEDDIYSNFFDGTKSTRLTNRPGNDADPSWDFTGKKIVYINDVDGNYDIYIMNSDGTARERLTETENDELSPIFLP